MIESLRTKLLAERRRNLVQEMEIRKEMGDAMLQQLMESEELRRLVIAIPFSQTSWKLLSCIKLCSFQHQSLEP